MVALIPVALIGIISPDLAARLHEPAEDLIGRLTAYLGGVHLEVLASLVISSIGFAVLPRRFRRPLWIPQDESGQRRISTNGSQPAWYSVLGVAVAFGGAAYLLVWGDIVLILPGTNLATDLREIFATIGSALTGPVYALLVGALAGLSEARVEMRWYVVLQHMVACLWAGWSYRRFVYPQHSTQRLVLAWGAVVLFYYFVAYLPVFFLTYWLSPATYRIIVGSFISPFEALPRMFLGWLPEIVFTVLATSVALAVLPPRYRRPLWIPAPPEEVALARTASQHGSFLGIRLSVWFLLLSVIPLVVIGVFIRQDVTDSIIVIESKRQQELARIIANVIAEHHADDPGAANHHLRVDGRKAISVINSDGVYLAHSESTKVGNRIHDEFGPETANVILMGREGYVIEARTRSVIGYSKVPGGRYTVVATLEEGLIDGAVRDLQRNSYIKLSISLILISIVAGLVIWMIVVRPMQKLTWAALQVGHGNLQATVDARDMDDEVGLLATAFNEMTASLRTTHEGLEAEIQHRKIAEEALRERERQFRVLAENSTDMISRHDVRGQYLYVSPSCDLVMGFDPAELVGRSAFDFIHPDDHAMTKQSLASLQTKRDVQLVTYRIRRKDGSYTWVESTTRSIEDASHNVFEIQVATRDIARRKQAELALMESEERLRTVVANLPLVLFSIDPGGTFTLSEGKGLEALRLRPGQVVGQSVFDVYREFPDVLKGIRRALGGEPHVEVYTVVDNLFETWLTPLLTTEGAVTGIIGVAVNVTERHRMQEAIKASEQMYKALVEQSSDAIYVIQNHRLVFVNRAWEEWFGYSVDEALSPAFDFFRIVAPESQPLMLERFRTYDAGTMPPLRYEMKGVTKNGEILDLDVSVARIPWRGRWAVQGVYRDITERKRSEQVILQKQKVESLGVLAGGVAHDFNNLLQAMLGHISLSLRRVPPESPAFANLQKAEKAAERASELTRQLLAYSGRGNFDIRPLSLNSIITENLHLLEVGVHKSIRLDKELASPLPLIDADAGQMQQVIMNLIINASEAIGERPGRILIRTQSMHVGADDVPLWSQPGNTMEVGEYVLLEVNDDGSGMSSDTLRRIFDPFFTTKFTGRGLGLSAILGIVRGHHGGIRVKSELGRGTSFQLIYPVSSTLVVPAESPTVQPAISQFKGSVLVVDDEADVREVVVDLLREAGLRTMVAPNGEAGLTIYRRFKHEIDIVLLDLSMPGMGGKETFRLLKAENPDVRVIMSSGFSESDAMNEISELGLAGFIQKPYQWSRLIDVLRRVMPAL